MSKIHILSEEVISKIAAGEVIERPASVIKELVENSIDAGATSIELHIKDAGKQLIHLKDNGSGIEREDLEKIFFRHATSKIAKADDLYDIHSLGFRGEALYSVAAIADIVLKSKTLNQPLDKLGTADSGWEIHLRGGKKLNLKPCPFAGHGTEIEVKELFFNTPARKKFLKSNTTEINQILNTFIPYTLLHNQIRFLLSHQDRTLLDLPSTSNLIERIAHTLHLDQKHLLETHRDSPQSTHSIHAVLGDINIKRARRDMQFIFVNGRPVQNKNIAFHMNQIYRLIMPQETYPFFAVYLTVPAEDVDVNIHPTKREVKIKDETMLCGILRSLCEEALMNNGQIKQASGVKALTPSFMATRSSETTLDFTIPPETFEASASSHPRSTDDYAFPRGQQTQIQEFFIPSDNAYTQKKDNLQNKLESARFIGSLLDKFLLFESGASLLVVDQHAAAERITYEQIIKQMDKSQLEVQNLLSPVLIKLSPQEWIVWEESQEDLEKMGLSTSQWDKETIAVHTHPILLKDTEKAVRQILSGEQIAKADFATMARRACRASIMAGDTLNREQAEYMREQLLQCLDPFTCPHGRPTIIEISEQSLDKDFGRT